MDWPLPGSATKLVCGCTDTGTAKQHAVVLSPLPVREEEVMGSPRAIADDRARYALGKSAAVLQHLKFWGMEALDGLDHHSAQLADLARALLRNHATGPQVQRLITLLDRGALGGGDGEGLMATRHQLLRFVFETVAGKTYSDAAWDEVTHAGALPFDPWLDQVILGSIVSRFGVVRGELWGQSLHDVPSQSSDLQGVTVRRIKKFNYPAQKGGGEVGDTETAHDRLGERAHLSLVVAIMFLNPAMINPGEYLVFSGRPMRGVGEAVRFPAVFRGADGRFWINLLGANQFVGAGYCTVRVVE